MSPRSEEFLASARQRILASRSALAGGFPSVAVSAAYYAMLYAARAALSEEEQYAKTHRGVWSLFGELFVASGRFEPGLLAAASRTQELREAADYDAREVGAGRAGEVIEDAARFVDAVAGMLDA